MLTHILTTEPAPLPATSHVLNQPTVGVGSPAGDPGTTDRGASAGAAPVESDGHNILRDFFIAQERRRERLLRRNSTPTGGDAA